MFLENSSFSMHLAEDDAEPFLLNMTLLSDSHPVKGVTNRSLYVSRSKPVLDIYQSTRVCRYTVVPLHDTYYMLIDFHYTVIDTYFYMQG